MKKQRTDPLIESVEHGRLGRCQRHIYIYIQIMRICIHTHIYLYLYLSIYLSIYICIPILSSNPWNMAVSDAVSVTGLNL